MKSTKELLGSRIKELRRNRQLTQEGLAELIGVEPRHLSRIESGGSYPSIDRLEKISIALKAPLKDFFEFNHLEDTADRLVSIETLAKNLNEERQRFVYRMLKALKEM